MHHLRQEMRKSIWRVDFVLLQEPVAVLESRDVSRFATRRDLAHDVDGA